MGDPWMLKSGIYEVDFSPLYIYETKSENIMN